MLQMQPILPFHAIPALASLSDDDQRELAPHCQLRGFEKGATIFTEGDPADRIYFVYLGRVKVSKSVGDRDVILDLIGPGEPVGAVAAFERRPFPASAIAVEPSSLFSISEPEFFRALEKHPEMTRRLLAGLTMRLMTLNKRLADMTGSLEQRAARLFLTLAGRLSEQRAGETFIPIALSRQDIADLLGTTIESAIRLMSRWQKEGLVATEKEGFRIANRSVVEEIAATGR
jgi:CRP/FNR family transcriptional regulator, nitrogen oxide reductase regulator